MNPCTYQTTDTGSLYSPLVVQMLLDPHKIWQCTPHLNPAPTSSVTYRITDSNTFSHTTYFRDKSLQRYD
jgi:hypothetical protein